MQCPRCWSARLHVRHVGIGRRILLGLALLVPIRCEHCFHKFTVSWFSTFGGRIGPPSRGSHRRASRPEIASRNVGHDGARSAKRGRASTTAISSRRRVA